jgi:hypothetical protein
LNNWERWIKWEEMVKKTSAREVICQEGLAYSRALLEEVIMRLAQGCVALWNQAFNEHKTACG